MAFIREIPPDEATGEVRDLYDSSLKTLGYVANYTKVFAHRPEVWTAWGSLIKAIRSNMDPALRARHGRCRIAAPVELLHARPRICPTPQ